MSLFALTKVPEPAIYRVPVTQRLATDIEMLFRDQEAAFVGDDTEITAFDGRYQPDEDEILEIAQFEDGTGIEAAVRNPIDVPEFQLTEENSNALAGLIFGYMAARNRPRALVQVFDKRRAVTSRGFTIWHSESVFRRWQGVALTFDTRLTAILHRNRLHFRSFFQLRKLFDMTEYYREATDADLEEFAEHERIYTADGFDLAEIADGWIRRRVGLISQSGILDRVSPRQLAGIADEFELSLQIRRAGGRESIELPPERKDLKRLLKFLDEDYYQSPLSDAKYVTNSKKRIN